MAARHAQDGPPQGEGRGQGPGSFDDDATQAMPLSTPDDDRTRAMPVPASDDITTRAMPRTPATDVETRAFATLPGAYESPAAADDAPTTVFANPVGFPPNAGAPNAGVPGGPGSPDDPGSLNTRGEPPRRRRWLMWTAIVVIVLLVIALVIALFALSDTGDDPAATTSAPAATTETTTAETVAPPPEPAQTQPAQTEEPPAMPVITEFSVSQTAVACTPGASIPLVFTWSSTGATEGWIGVGTNDAQAAPYDEIDPAAGTYTGISFQCGQASQTYALTVSGPGGVLSQTVTVSAEDAPPADAATDADSSGAEDGDAEVSGGQEP